MTMLHYRIFIISGFIFLSSLLCPAYADGAGDLCLDAILVSESTPYVGNTSGATGSSVSSCSFNDTKDVWHSFTPSQSGNYTISLCGSSFDTTLSVYDECEGVELACNDDMCSVYSEVVVDLTALETYLIRVAGYNGAVGTYVLEATKRPSPPANDDIGGAVEVFEDVPYEGDTLGATGETFSSCADGYDFYDLWHVFVPSVTTEAFAEAVSILPWQYMTTAAAASWPVMIICATFNPKWLSILTPHRLI